MMKIVLYFFSNKDTILNLTMIFYRAWNRRTPQTCVNVISELPSEYSDVEGAFSCSKCGFTIIDHDGFELLACFQDRIKDIDADYIPMFIPKWKYCPNCGARVINYE